MHQLQHFPRLFSKGIHLEYPRDLFEAFAGYLADWEIAVPILLRILHTSSEQQSSYSLWILEQC